MTSEVIIRVGFFISGYAAGKVLDFLTRKFAKHFKITRNRKNIQLISNQEFKDINVLYSGIPYYSVENIKTIYEPTNQFFLEFPEEMKTDLHLKTQSEINSFSQKEHFFQDLTIPGIKDEIVKEAIEKSKQKIAEKFVEREDGLYFNGLKFGLIKTYGFGRTADDQELPQLALHLFETDHFTHRVVSDVFASLKIKPSMLTVDNLNSSLSWVRTSFGLSILIILKKTNEIIMTRRSPNASFTNGLDLIYVSVTESFSDTDFDGYENTADLKLCLERGISEELGIKRHMLVPGSEKFYDTFFETHFYQDGIIASVELKEEYDINDVINLSAKDKQLEIASIFTIDNSINGIETFIDENKEDMQAQTIFALESYKTRLMI